MEDGELQCSCGNPACSARIHVRKGYVFIRHPDGTEETRWDYFYLDAMADDGTDFKMVELMMTPQQAKSLMWFLVFGFMPGVHQLNRALFNLWVTYPRDWYLSALDWWEERSRASQDST